MGQKVSPVGFRVGVIRDWESRWYAEKEYGDLLQEDIKVRKLIEKECNTKEYMVSRVEIERSKNRLNLVIRTARPGMFVGADGAKLDDLKKKIAKMTSIITFAMKWMKSIMRSVIWKMTMRICWKN